ncbi:hypothetical protein [Candidatus Chlamydia sanziniae]|uniref:Uncharacterized protein n=1 Tax=Candidatus Chlamydia sanziniae TaxID=1806891 RepID=A0A1A9HVF1_9CHLA|nr:hypothetical protein [Candidatus Chlamydia sanziniae]ANH78980.1 hypothetical protein Cs308_0810 [Candidatus Chlamydia sanziniae]
MIPKYTRHIEFVVASTYFPCCLVQRGFVRNARNLMFPLGKSAGIELKRSFFASIPILGILMGMERLYSVWSTKDLRDSRISICLHTLVGILEVLGLGIILVFAKILLLILLLLFFTFYNLCSSFCLRGKVPSYVV